MPLPGSFKNVFKKKDISDPNVVKYRDQDYNKVRARILTSDWFSEVR